MGPLEVFALIILWVVPCYICHEQGKPKHRRGLAWGVCLGWIGVLALAALPAAEPAERVGFFTVRRWLG